LAIRLGHELNKNALIEGFGEQTKFFLIRLMKSMGKALYKRRWCARKLIGGYERRTYFIVIFGCSMTWLSL